MTRATIAGGAFVTALVLLVLVLVVRYSPLAQDVESPAATVPATTPSVPEAGPTEVHPGFLYGRITAVDGVTYEGRLRWGGDQEAFWGDYFNGAKAENPWEAHEALLRQSGEPSPIEIFGFHIGGRDRRFNLDRQFMARFGDIARIEARDGGVRVRLKSGTVFALNRSDAGDIDDGVRVWDSRRGVVDVDAERIRTIELVSTEPLVAAPARLHGTVRARQGDFTGFIQWNRQDSVGADVLFGRTADGEQRLRYDTIRSIARHSRGSALVTLLDGREMVLSDTPEVGDGNLGLYVDDPRYGRVLVSWDAFEKVEFSPGSSGPAYGDFPPGRPLTGTVTTRDGRRLAGRLVYDFDESETTETFDVSVEGVDYNIPFSLIASIVPGGREAGRAGRARAILRNGEELQVERTGDLGERNAGLLIFVEGRERPEYRPLSEVERVDLEPPPSWKSAVSRD